MSILKPAFKNLILLMYISLATSCSAIAEESEIVLVGSTPGDEPITSMLSISTTTQVDFIKWNLKLNENKTFALNVTYGESQPNTLGFKRGGQTKSFLGSFVIDKAPENKHFKEVYQLKSHSFARTILLVKLNENLFHILTSDHQLMVGNGGWSYSLNRTNPGPLEKVLISSAVSDEKKALQMVFDGRTPCKEISAEHPEMNASTSCFKLKWKLVLNRDSVTYTPTTCVIRKVVDNQPQDVTGKWTIIHGTTENPDVVIYKIETDTDALLSFLAGDDHVLFFLDKKGDPFVGNENFSFTLNRRVSE